MTKVVFVEVFPDVVDLLDNEEINEQLSYFQEEAVKIDKNRLIQYPRYQTMNAYDYVGCDSNFEVCDGQSIIEYVAFILHYGRTWWFEF